MSGEDETQAPTVTTALRIVSGAPTAEELAVLTALLAARSGGGHDDASPALRGGWNDPSRQHRAPLLPGPNGWRSSTW